ncbi:MAG TPA: SUMF1/EgtB/PvdO family nonheme iron enzyme [Anaerolineales bacterium]|nr:SUMF1/EgtB/PvdO family nonheme iron enzyme [Anaerolineales bacterium]
MKKRTSIPLFFILVLSACGGQITEVPIIESTATPIPTTEPTAISPTVEIIKPTVMPTEEAPKFQTSSIDGMPQVYIPAGIFHMGGYDIRAAQDEFPGHEVTLDAYWMDQLEVTNAMYQLCVTAGQCTPPQNLRSQRRDDYYQNPEFKDYPVVYVAWIQAKEYCEWAGRRLPTEAEWERAARGDDFRTFPWGEDKPNERFANFNFIVKDTSRVGSYSLGASPFGILDMAGNVAEWTNDIYSPTFYASAESMFNPVGPVSSSSLKRVVRGGSLGDAEINIRVSKRSSVLGSDLRKQKGSPEYLGDFSPRIGFRCVMDE